MISATQNSGSKGLHGASTSQFGHACTTVACMVKARIVEMGISYQPERTEAVGHGRSEIYVTAGCYRAVHTTVNCKAHKLVKLLELLAVTSFKSPQNLLVQTLCLVTEIFHFSHMPSPADASICPVMIRPMKHRYTNKNWSKNVHKYVCE